MHSAAIVDHSFDKNTPLSLHHAQQQVELFSPLNV